MKRCKTLGRLAQRWFEIANAQPGEGGLAPSQDGAFFRNPASAANKQPHAAVIADTAAALSPSIATGSIGSRSRLKQRS
jgi:hypothetical protein